MVGGWVVDGEERTRSWLSSSPSTTHHPPSTIDLIDLLDPTAADLAAANDVETERIEAHQVRVAQDIDDIVERQCLPLMQADENIAAANAGPSGGAVGVHGGHFEAAVQLAVDARHQFAVHRR